MAVFAADQSNFLESTRTTTQCKWTVAIFASRESAVTLKRTVTAAMDACKGSPSSIEILVNGNSRLSSEMTGIVQGLVVDSSNCTVNLWFIAGADKAHTWNAFLRSIANTSNLTFFVDGYVSLNADALALLKSALHENPDALAATGVPTVGRTAKALRASMLAHGGIHGNLYAIRPEVLEKLKQADFALPIGLYRSDPFLGAMFSFNLDSANYRWDSKRIFVHPLVSWQLSTAAVSMRSYAKTMWKRAVRQGQGTLENIALRDHLAVQRLPPHSVPRTVQELISGWVKKNRSTALAIFWKSPVTYYAYSKLLAAKPLADLGTCPVLLASTQNSLTEVPSAGRTSDCQ